MSDTAVKNPSKKALQYAKSMMPHIRKNLKETPELWEATLRIVANTFDAFAREVEDERRSTEKPLTE